MLERRRRCCHPFHGSRRTEASGAPIVTSGTCPKCHGRMRTVDRQGVRIEQCQNCRGLFLDHGELERSIEETAAAVCGWLTALG